MSRARILVVAPHADDEVLGCGGMIQRHKERGDTVSVVCLANRVMGHRHSKAYADKTKKIARKASALLGVDELTFCDLRDELLDRQIMDIVIPLENVLNRIRPTVVYVPNPADQHQDHRAVASAAFIACRGVKNLFAYETPGSGKGFDPNYYCDIGKYFAKKLRAMELYAGEMRNYPHPRSARGLEVYSRFRGMEAGVELAEAFRVIRQMAGDDRTEGRYGR